MFQLVGGHQEVAPEVFHPRVCAWEINNCNKIIETELEWGWNGFLSLLHHSTILKCLRADWMDY